MRYVQASNGLLVPDRRIRVPRSPRRQRGFIGSGIGFWQKPNSGTGDPYWANVVSLLHFDGADGSKTITDEITTNTWRCGNAVALDTSQVKFGTAALQFPSLSVANNLNGPANLSPFGGDFTAEFWVYPIQNSSSFSACFFGVDKTSGPRGFQIDWQTDNTVSVAVAGVTTTIKSTNTINLNAWNHVAACASGTTMYVCLNGVVTTGAWVVGAGNTGLALTFGTHLDGVTNFLGSFDEFRLTKGVARYTSSFTPPTAPFPNHA